MNDAERAIVRDGLREIAARLELVQNRDPDRGNERLLVDGREYVLLTRTLTTVPESLTPAVAAEDADLPEQLRGERAMTKLVYRIVYRVRSSAAGPTAILCARHIIAAIPEVLGEERSDSAVHQATRRLKRLGYIRKARRLGWLLSGAETASGTAPEPPNCNPNNAVSSGGNAA